MGLNYSYFQDTATDVSRAAVMTYGSIRAAARQLNVNYSTFRNIVTGKTKTVSEKVSTQIARGVGYSARPWEIYAGARHMKGKDYGQVKQSWAKAKNKKGWYKRTVVINQKAWRKNLDDAGDETFTLYGSP